MPSRVDFAEVSNPWSEYRLHDGHVIRIRYVLTNVIDTGKVAPNGVPLYEVNGQMIMDVTPGEDLIKIDPANLKKDI